MAWTLSSVTAPVDSPEQAMREIRDRATGASAALLNPRFASWLPLGTTTPPTFDAFKEFVRGDELILSRRARDALPYLRSATALDTTFTWARLQIASAYLNVLDTEGADSIAASLNRMHQRLTPLELSWLAWMDALIEENEVEANRAMARAADLAPDRFLDLHAETLRWLNRPVEIVKLLRHAGPGSPYHSGGAPYWGRLADSYHQLGQHRRELAVTAHMRRYQPADVQALWLEIRALAALGRTKEVTTRLEFAEALPRETPLSPGSLMRQAAEELRAHGHPQAAAAVLDRIIVWYDGLPREDAGKVNNRFEVARALYLVGRLDAAESLFEQLAIDDPDSLAEYDGALGVIAARRGDRATAERFLAALERQRLAIDPPPRYAMYAQARIVALLGDPDRAVRMLREALGGQGRDLHMDADFEPLARDPGFKGFIRPKG
jgi:tetratricopeptide (TPR) repeat protein